jgi:hypothetical protein
MGVDREVLHKGIQYMAWALPLMFIGPSVIYNAFINKNNAWHYLVLGIGIAISFGAVFLLFKGVQTIVKSLFDNNNDA